MADILIRGMEMPTNVFDCPLNSFGICNLAQDETHCDCIGDSRPEWCPLVPLPEGHGDLIERKALNLFPDYNEVRNGIKRTIKETARDGRAITGVSIDLLKQTLVALDSLRSVRRYFMNAKTIVPAEGGTDNG